MAQNVELRMATRGHGGGLRGAGSRRLGAGLDAGRGGEGGACPGGRGARLSAAGAGPALGGGARCWEGRGRGHACAEPSWRSPWSSRGLQFPTDFILNYTSPDD